MEIDKDKLFSLGEKEFDDSPDGWRSVSDGTEDGYINSAKIIEEYINEVEGSSYLWFHAGQCWASAGEEYYTDALRCFKKSSENNHSEQARIYRLATIAFLENRLHDLKNYLKEIKKHVDPSSLTQILECMVEQLERDGRPDYNKMYGAV